MKFFEKKIPIYCPINGEVKDLSKVNDDMFATKLMGDGFAIVPKGSKIYSPVKGRIASVFPTKHAISIKTKNQQDVLIHIGIDTVELAGEGFTINVNEGDEIDQHTELGEVDFDFIRQSNKETDVIVVFPESTSKELMISYGDHTHQEEIGYLK
jgi:PTS system glucose-specific IIA component